MHDVNWRAELIHFNVCYQIRLNLRILLQLNINQAHSTSDFIYFITKSGSVLVAN